MTGSLLLHSKFRYITASQGTRDSIKISATISYNDLMKPTFYGFRLDLISSNLDIQSLGKFLLLVSLMWDSLRDVAGLGDGFLSHQGKVGA
jgi:hypothetical protein